MTRAPSELMTVADFCARYRIGKTSLYREAAAGRIRLRKFGAATRIAREDAEAWAASLPIIAGGANAAA
jgi:excisionase family DNA binding protein